MKWLIRHFFRTIRKILGPVILLVDKLTTPKGITRSEQQQKRVDAETKALVLYQFKTCPFCIKVRRANKRMSLNIKMLDAQYDRAHREELLKNGGQIKVPCLKITDPAGQTTWLYESSQIIEYLEDRYAA